MKVSEWGVLTDIFIRKFSRDVINLHDFSFLMLGEGGVDLLLLQMVSGILYHLTLLQSLL